MRIVAVSLVALAIATTAQAAPAVQAAWSRPAAEGMTGVGFMTLANPGRKPDALVAVESAGARQVQIHQSSMSNGVASMRPVSSLPLPAGGQVAFAPGGYHLMFLGLAKAQKVGDRLTATLIFASGARVKVAFVVDLAPPIAEHHHHP